MDAKMKKELITYGINMEDTLKRFMGNEELYGKFLEKFLHDDSYNQLKISLQEQDLGEAYKNAHMLKGVTANLGIDPLSKVVAILVEDLIVAKVDRIEKLMKDIDKKYVDIINIIEKY
mgnify:CR=1 FL=1